MNACSIGGAVPRKYKRVKGQLNPFWRKDSREFDLEKGRTFVTFQTRLYHASYENIRRVRELSGSVLNSSANSLLLVRWLTEDPFSLRMRGN
jgi:hypothetical protein